jgi:CelD/BcsL family acetyltransferase involved in cellulose biosynthesis
VRSPAAVGVQLIRVRLVPISVAGRDRRLLARWTELEQESLEPNPFFAPEMVLPAARHLEGGDATHLLLADTYDRLLFLLPVSGGRGFGGIKLPLLKAWVHDYCFLGTPLVSAHDDPVQIWTAVASILRRARPAPLLVVQLHTDDGPVAAALRRADAQAGLKVRYSPATRRGFVHRRSEPTYATEWVAKKHLANLARRRRQLSRTLGCPVDTVDRAATGLDGAIEEFLHLEASGWKRQTGTALQCRPGHDQFFRELSRGFGEQGRLMLLSLQSETKMLAQSTALLAGPGLFGFKKAYDEDFARWSPGTLLDLDVLMWFHDTPQLRWLDTCSSTDAPAGSPLFGDRRTIRTLLVPLSPAGTVAATLLAASLRGRTHLRGRLDRRSA